MLFDLFFYASCIHSNIHILHYILTAALDKSSQDFGALNEWARFHATNIPGKYFEVGEVLIRKQPDILDLLRGGNEDTVKDTYAALTGKVGFGANGDKLIPLLKKLLSVWTKDPTNYLENMMNVPKEKLVEAGILTEFMKHHDMVPDYAQDVTEALKKTDEEKFEIAEERLTVSTWTDIHFFLVRYLTVPHISCVLTLIPCPKVYLKRSSGFTSGIDSLTDWIELMAVTGIFHGCTLSYSRLFADVDVLKWRDYADVWQATDVKFILQLLLTVCGMDEHRHVMTSSTDVVGEEYDEKLQKVLEKYDQKASDYKEAYCNKIMEDTEEFNNYGWILSDFCPDGFDGKQLTVSAYF